MIGIKHLLIIGFLSIINIANSQLKVGKIVYERKTNLEIPVSNERDNFL